MREGDVRDAVRAPNKVPRESEVGPGEDVPISDVELAEPDVDKKGKRILPFSCLTCTLLSLLGLRLLHAAEDLLDLDLIRGREGVVRRLAPAILPGRLEQL
jgi:hypothetical protein